MKLVLKERASQTIRAYDLKDGELAIVDDAINCQYNGRIVQCTIDGFVSIGMRSLHTFPIGCCLQCRKLQIGDILEIR
jgi:pyrimidine operon attenuation protein/uracil phosphoribosyltransferase